MHLSACRLCLVLLWISLASCADAGSPRMGGAAGGGGTGGMSPLGASGGGAAGGGASGAAQAGANSGSAGEPPAIAGSAGLGAVGGTGSSAGAAGSAGLDSGGQGGVANNGGSSSSSYRPCPTDGSPCKIMPFGDSITDGYNPDTPGGYRVELFRQAHAAGQNVTFVGSSQNGPELVDGVPFPHQHEGHSGWTIAPAGGRSGISTLVSSTMPQFKPHIVLLMIGTNDAIDNYDMSNAPARLGALIDAIYAQLPDVLIVVAQPIPSRGDASKGDDTALSARLKTFGDAIPGLVKSRADAGRHLLVVDMNTAFAGNKSTLLEDQWHPNLAGYALIAQQWYAVLQSSLAR